MRYLGRRPGTAGSGGRGLTRFVAVLAPSCFQGGSSFEVVDPFAKLFDRSFDLEHRGFELSQPFISLRPEYDKIIVARAHRFCRR